MGNKVVGLDTRDKVEKHMVRSECVMSPSTMLTYWVLSLIKTFHMEI
jgi:hypothetical protein